jgi:hypothetical protein
MHVRSSLFVNVRRSLPVARLAASACACALLSGCVANPWKDAEVDPRSPVAAEVAKSVRADASYPTFGGIPPVPKDVRPHRQYGQQAARTERDAADLMAATADSTWTLNNTETFAETARAAAGPALPPADPSETAAFAKAQKARATAPPPAKR